MTDSNVRAGLLLAAALGLAGCAQPATDARTSASGLSGVRSVAAIPTAGVPTSGAAPGRVTLAGVARMYGGPATSAGSMALNGDPGQGITVTAIQDGRAVASMVTGADGRFSLTLPPGTYLLTGCAEVTVVVGPTALTRHDIDCPVP